MGHVACRAECEPAQVPARLRLDRVGQLATQLLRQRRDLWSAKNPQQAAHLRREVEAADHSLDRLIHQLNRLSDEEAELVESSRPPRLRPLRPHRRRERRRLSLARHSGRPRGRSPRGRARRPAVVSRAGALPRAQAGLARSTIGRTPAPPVPTSGTGEAMWPKVPRGREAPPAHRKSEIAPALNVNRMAASTY
jgi:hypothetical protein